MEGSRDPSTGTIRIGRFDFAVESIPVPDSQERRGRRAEALAAWLMAEWRREMELKESVEAAT